MGDVERTEFDLSGAGSPGPARSDRPDRTDRGNDALSDRMLPGDDDAELSLRPRSLTEFIGQPKVRGQLDLVLGGARARGVVPDHVLLAGPPGLGKTTLAGQLVRARLGLQRNVLELPVAEGGRLLYLAMDRPQQIGRRLRQQLSAGELEGLVGTGRLVLGIGPPPQDLAKHPELLPELCRAANADTLVVDSVKDAAVGLTDDEVGAGYNRARQLAITAGVQAIIQPGGSIRDEMAIEVADRHHLAMVFTGMRHFRH